MKTLTFAFGRFQPPTRGHQLLMVTAQKVAGDGELRIYPSRTQDAKKNPLHPKQKHHFLRVAFPSMASCFVDDERVRTALDVLTIASDEGFQKAVMVVGSDRLETFRTLTAKYNGDLYCLEKIQVVSCGDRDPDADGVEGISGTQMRKAAVEADFNAFLLGLPDAMSITHARDLFTAVANGLAKKDPKGAQTPGIPSSRSGAPPPSS